ncbi:4,5-DOPA dioxygenase extradiol [Stella humosa]|uniref:4,5-DOPA dioxygenase extradiol n=1 Tax=Stella humosa TaxID=94 RepID=A0A3N1LH33_9PROT|nr:class III extradiol ring-cleavage dioxygenase [Stella humosa]ROP90534.1 4,5-DOPA dioxygenase extradiol [Stella humosa]BBK29571.1 dioxygenase [Stella humosa]
MTGPLFLSHGSPMLYLTDTPAHRFLAGLEIGRPRAIVVASAHWETDRPAVGAAGRPGTIHDFGGFPEALHRARYPAPGDPIVAGEVVAALAAAGIPAVLDPGRGLDHGIWVPLAIALPGAEVPLVPLALQPELGPLHHLALGRALAPLAASGILVVGSGAVTHNLHATRGQAVDAPAPAWVDRFRDWVAETVAAGDADRLCAYRTEGPAAEVNHPTEEHFLPLLVALGAAGAGATGRRIHASVEYGVIGMDNYAFGIR